VTLTGTHLSGATVVVTPLIAVTNLTLVNDSTITATFTLAASLSVGAKLVELSAPAGISNAVSFTVLGPVLTSITPASGTHGTAVPVTLTGTNLTGVTAVTVSGTGVTVSNVTGVNSTTITATFTISSTAAQTQRLVYVTTSPGGSSNNIEFAVN